MSRSVNSLAALGSRGRAASSSSSPVTSPSALSAPPTQHLRPAARWCRCPPNGGSPRPQPPCAARASSQAVLGATFVTTTAASGQRCPLPSAFSGASHREQMQLSSPRARGWQNPAQEEPGRATPLGAMPHGAGQGGGTGDTALTAWAPDTAAAAGMWAVGLPQTCPHGHPGTRPCRATGRAPPNGTPVWPHLTGGLSTPSPSPPAAPLCRALQLGKASGPRLGHTATGCVWK